MYLKKYYLDSGEIDYISVAHTGVSREQHFSTSLVTEYLKLGLMELHDDELIFKTYPEHLRYTVIRVPGRYCLHCGEKLPDDQSGELARLHVAMQHTGNPSPDKNNPAGYEAIHYFDCMLDVDQHEKYKAVPGRIAYGFPEKAG